jgi:HSP20 family protein
MNEFTIDIEKQLSRLGRDIQDFVERIVPLEDRGHDFTPDCDIIEGEDTFKIKLDLPGMSKEEIHISLKEHVLTVKGERVDESESGSYVRQERKTGLFSRAFALPETVDTSDTEAVFKQGVLTITMKKSDTPENAKSIPIK